MFDFFKKPWSKEKAQAAFWLDYARLFEEKTTLKTALSTQRIVVLDTETTGFSIKKDKICQIGAVAVRKNRIELKDFFNTIVWQASGGTKTEKEIHGLRDSDLLEGMEIREALEQFVGYIGDAILVAHHASFDINMLNQALKRHFGAAYKLKNPVLDTVELERRIRGKSAFGAENPSEFTLDTLAEKYNVELHDRHTALGDAFITALIFLKIKAQLEARGTVSIGDFLRR